MKLRIMAKTGALAATFALGVVGVALAQSNGLNAANQRQENFELLGATFKTLKDELTKDTPDRVVLAKASATVNALSHELPTWFPRGSGKEARPKSLALDNVWTNFGGFAEAVNKFNLESTKLTQLAKTNDIDAIRIQFQATGKACGACHSVYREKKS